VTVRQYVCNYLSERGMSETRSSLVIGRLKAESTGVPLASAWDEDIERFPAMFKGVLSAVINRVALKHIDEDCPNAWYRELFVK
jgi:hypothetical protein